MTRPSRFAWFVPLLVLTLSSCARVEPPWVVLTGLDYAGVSDKGVEFTLNADVTNPNSFGAALSRLEYEVYVDGEKLAHGLRLEDVVIAEEATVRVGIPFTLTWEGAKGGMTKLLDGEEHDWKLVGSAVLKKGGIARAFTFAETGRFGGPSPSQAGTGE